MLEGRIVDGTEGVEHCEFTLDLSSLRYEIELIVIDYGQSSDALGEEFYMNKTFLED